MYLTSVKSQDVGGITVNRKKLTLLSILPQLHLLIPVSVAQMFSETFFNMR